jgi:NAD(P)-dependent dehydrogenase (short-subunit alcohol dehydrogenase family)
MTIRFDYRDKTVLVTGGSQGIGHAIATAFVDAGAVVHVTGTRALTQDYDADLSIFTIIRCGWKSRPTALLLRRGSRRSMSTSTTPHVP